MAEMKDDNDELTMLEKDIKEFWTKFKTICCSEPSDQVLGLRDSWYESINNLSGKTISGLFVAAENEILSIFFSPPSNSAINFGGKLTMEKKKDI